MLLSLFLTFAKIGIFTFGGGYAMIAMIESICVGGKGWITHDEMMDITVIAESTPGPIAINCATYVGYKMRGFAGALAATVGIVLPSFVIIYVISVFFENFMEIQLVASAFKGIRLAVGILILYTAVNMIKKMQKKPLPRSIMLCACVVMLVFKLIGIKVSSILLMLLAGLVSLSLYTFRGGKNNSGGKAG